MPKKSSTKTKCFFSIPIIWACFNVNEAKRFESLEARIQRVSETELYIPIIAFHERMKGWSAYLAKASTESEVIFAYGKFREILADFASVQLLDYSVSASAV